MNEVAQKIKESLDPRLLRLLATEIPKGEALLPQATPNSRAQSAVVGNLTTLYQVMNEMLGRACQLLEYPPVQIRWPDSKPLEVIAQILPGLEATNWYQNHLGAMLIQKNHPWTKILTSLTPETKFSPPVT